MYKASPENNAKWRFQVPPAKPSENEIKKVIDCDVVVVGAGLGGLSAAVRLKELGADVILIEKWQSYTGRGGHFGVVNSTLMKENGIEYKLDEIARQWITMSGNNIDESLLWLFLRRSGEAMDWLIPKAKNDGLDPKLVDCIYPVAPYKEYYGAHCFPPKGGIRGNFVSKALYNDGIKKGLKVYFNCPAEQLIKVDGKITGIYAKDSDGYIQFNTKKGVVLATGDIGSDSEMCKAYAPDALRTLDTQYVPRGCNTGDGHKMALWAGASMAEEVFPLMMHPQHYTTLLLFFLFVNQKGERFMNEDSYVQGRATQFMRQPDGTCYSIIDANWKEGLEESLKYGGGISWGNAGLRLGNEWTADGPAATIQKSIDTGNAFKADSLEELAEKINVPADKLITTVERYNQLCEAGEDSDFGKRKELLYPIKKGPFIALKMGTVLLAVVGGLAIDTKIRVLDENREPIPGLYAVGDTTGGMYGHEYVTTILGNSHGRALTWGYIAAESIMEK